MLVWLLHRYFCLFWLRGDAYSAGRPLLAGWHTSVTAVDIFQQRGECCAVPKQYMSKNTALAPFFWADSMVVEGNAQREKGRQQAT